MPAAIAYDAPLHPADRRAEGDRKRSLACHRCKVTKASITLQTALFCRQCFSYHFDAKMRMSMELAKVCAVIHRTEGQRDLANGSSAVSSTMGKARAEPPSHAAGSSNNAHVGSTKSASSRVVLAFSGGPSSLAMLHMARKRLLPPPGFERQTGKAFEIFSIDVIYIDDDALFNRDTGDRTEDRTAEVRNLVEECGGANAGLHFTSVKLEEVYDEATGAVCSAGPSAPKMMRSASTSVEPCSALKALFRALKPSDTPRSGLANANSRIEDMHRLLVMHLLRREATRRGAACLLTGETATRRAVRVIDGISRGRGYKLPLEEGSARWRGLYTLQPMSDSTSKEIAYYLHTAHLRAIAPRDLVAMDFFTSSPTSAKGDKASINRLTESLVYLLEANVPGTISTVNRTSSKLIFSDDAASHGYRDEQETAFAINAGEIPAFDQVGPVLPLRFRKQMSSTTSSFAQMSMQSGSSTRPDATTTQNRPNVRGMGLGGLGAKLYASAQSFPHDRGNSACPLCLLPAQRGLGAWKRGLTISPQRDGGQALRAQSAVAAGNASVNLFSSGPTIDLSALVCYACGILLDTPETTQIDAEIRLPSYVLFEAEKRMAEDAKDDTELSMLHDGKQEESEQIQFHHTESQSSSGMRQQDASAIRKLNREQMRERVDDFLLEDDGREALDSEVTTTSMPLSRGLRASVARPSLSTAAGRSLGGTDW